MVKLCTPNTSDAPPLLTTVCRLEVAKNCVRKDTKDHVMWMARVGTCPPIERRYKCHHTISEEGRRYRHAATGGSSVITGYVAFG